MLGASGWSVQWLSRVSSNQAIFTSTSNSCGNGWNEGCRNELLRETKATSASLQRERYRKTERYRERQRGRAVTEEYLPDVYLRLRSRFPTVAAALDSLGEATASAGGLDERTQRLVKLGIAIGASAEGAVRSNTRRALAAGASPEEVLQVAVLAITTRGFPAAVAAFSWIEEVLTAGT